LAKAAVNKNVLGYV